MKSRKLFVLAAIALSLSSCGAVDYVKEEVEATELIQKDVAEQGWDNVQIG